MTTRRPDAGFTLIETIIAMLIMSIAIVTIVGALGAMIIFTSEHRGHAVVEVGSRSYSQAVQAQGQFRTALKAPPGSGATLSVTDASLVPPASADTFITVNREVMLVTGVNRAAGTVTVQRGVTGTAPPGGHQAGDAVIPFTRCGGSAVMDPDKTAYQAAPGLTFKVENVEYWRPTGGGAGTFVNVDDCRADFAERCSAASTVLAECTSGLTRVKLAISSSDTTNAAYDKRLRNIDSTTVVLVRRGSI